MSMTGLRRVRTTSLSGGRMFLGGLLIAFLLLGGVVGLAVSLLVVVASLSAMVSRRIERWRARKVERYIDEVEATQEVLSQQLAAAQHEIAGRDRQIARLQRRSEAPEPQPGLQSRHG